MSAYLQIETLLHELKDKGIIGEWFYNGEYHWKYAEPKEPNWEQCTGCAYDAVSPEKEPCKSCVDNNMYTEQKPEKKYRKFKDCEELVKHWDTHYGSINRPKNTMPLVWVRGKKSNSVNLITAYNVNESRVSIQNVWFFLSELFDKYEFLDGTPCGVEE